MIPVLFINCQGQPFVDQIMERLKTEETRTRNTLKSLMEWALGERILIAETGKGSPLVRCSAVIDRITAVYTREEWEKHRSQTQIAVGSKYDWKPDTKVKWLYHLSDVQPVEPFRITEGIRHGRVWMEYEGSVNDDHP